MSRGGLGERYVGEVEGELSPRQGDRGSTVRRRGGDKRNGGRRGLGERSFRGGPGSPRDLKALGENAPGPAVAATRWETRVVRRMGTWSESRSGTVTRTDHGAGAPAGVQDGLGAGSEVAVGAEVDVTRRIG